MKHCTFGIDVAHGAKMAPVLISPAGCDAHGAFVDIAQAAGIARKVTTIQIRS